MRIKHRQKNYNRITWAIALAFITSLAFVRYVSAHAYLIRSDPAANSILESVPATMQLWFSENITQEFSGARLLDANGQATDLEVELDPADHSLLIAKLPELDEGVYSLRWSVHSETDGHITQGLVIFGLGQGADLGTATAVETNTEVPWPELLIRWLNFVLYAGLIGGFAMTYFVLNPQSLPPPTARLQRTAQKRMLRLAWICSLLAFFTGFAWAAWQAVSLAGAYSGDLSITNAAWQWLTQTQLGYYWWARQITLLVVAANLYFLRARPPEAPRPVSSIALTTIFLLALLLIQSLTSHAAALTPNTALAVSADALHLMAATFWVGGLLALIVGLLPLVRHDSDFTTLAKAAWGPFGKWAALSVVLIFVTGIYSTFREVGSVNALLTTFYGKTLLFKIGLVLIVGLIGAFNSTLLHPRLAAPLARYLQKPEGWTPLSLQRLPRLLVAELALGLLVLLLAAVLTTAPTARGTAFAADPLPAADLSQTVDDMFIKLTVNPNQAGQNIFTVRAVSQRRPPPAEVLRVILRFTYLDQDLGLSSIDMNEIEPDLYLLSGNQLYLAGYWQIDVVVRRLGLEDSVARYEWFVPQTAQ